MSGSRHVLPTMLALLVSIACREGGVVSQQRVAGGVPARGQRAILAYGCGSCHVIPGVPAAEGRVGPPLTDFAERSYIAGRVRNEPVALVRWIRDPQTIDSATVMPDLAVGEADARDIAAYLYTLAPGRLGPASLWSARLLPGH